MKPASAPMHAPIHMEGRPMDPLTLAKEGLRCAPATARNGRCAQSQRQKVGGASVWMQSAAMWAPASGSCAALTCKVAQREANCRDAGQHAPVFNAEVAHCNRKYKRHVSHDRKHREQPRLGSGRRRPWPPTHRSSQTWAPRRSQRTWAHQVSFPLRRGDKAGGAQRRWQGCCSLPTPDPPL
jgi:hypothetical protein